MVEAATSDAVARAKKTLGQSPISELRELQVEQRGSALVIRGVVSRFYHKQLAQEVVRAVCAQANLELVNSVEVRS